MNAKIATVYCEISSAKYQEGIDKIPWNGGTLILSTLLCNYCTTDYNLLKKDQDYIWSSKCQDVFVEVKSLLLSNPVLMAPDFQKKFILMVDATNLGAGAVLMQCDVNIQFVTFLVSLLALQHFDVYLNTTKHPII